jgi:hypothetical protein
MTGLSGTSGPAPLIGAHQMTARVGAYLVAMGVGDPVMALTRKTPAGGLSLTGALARI